MLPDEVQLNTPTRPKPFEHQLEARGNQTWSHLGYPVRALKPVSIEVLEQFADRIQAATNIPVRFPPSLLSTGAD